MSEKSKDYFQKDKDKLSPILKYMINGEQKCLSYIKLAQTMITLSSPANDQWKECWIKTVGRSCKGKYKFKPIFTYTDE